MFNRRQWIRWGSGLATSVAVAGLGAPAWVGAQTRLEKSRLVLGVQDLGNMNQLPLLLGHELGHFEQEGLQLQLVEEPDFAWSARRVPSAELDVLSGCFEKNLAIWTLGRPHTAFALVSRTPQVVLGVSPTSFRGTPDARDLSGHRIGVTGLGSVSHMVAQLVFKRAGLGPADVRFVDVVSPSQALLAFRHGQVAGLSVADPLVSALEQAGEIRVIADMRIPRDAEQVYGGPVPALCLSASSEFVQRHPRTCQALTDGLVRTLKWLHTAGPSDIARNVPGYYMQGDRAVYMAAFSKMRHALSPDGVIPAAGPATVLRALLRLNPGVETDRIDLARTFTNEFAQRAKARFKA